MSDPQVVEKKTTITQPVESGQSTNINVRPDGGADVEVNDGNPTAVVEETTTTTRRTV